MDVPALGQLPGTLLLCVRRFRGRAGLRELEELTS